MDPDSDPDHSQNLITWSLSHLGHILKISSKSLYKFLSYLSLKITEDPDSDPNHSQNLITSSFYHFGHILKILSKSVHKFLSYLFHKQTDGQTNPDENITTLAEVIKPMYQFYGICCSFLSLAVLL